MKKIIMIIALLALSACGYSQVESEAIGQVKKVANMTEILCPRRVDVDISLGIMRDGVGSMSSQDVWLTVKDPKHVVILKKANESGKLVKFKYDVARYNFCWEQKELIDVEILK
jgi:hypothetical protein